VKTHLSSQSRINEAVKLLASIKPNGEYSIEIKKLPKSRTALQNRALHLYLTQLADELNANDLTVQLVLNEAVERHWDMETVKAQLWSPIQKSLFGDVKTSKMNTKAYGKVDFYLSHFLSTKFGISVPFPHIENKEVKR
jgi:hypothetical protein